MFFCCVCLYATLCYVRVVYAWPLCARVGYAHARCICVMYVFYVMYACTLCLYVCVYVMCMGVTHASWVRVCLYARYVRTLCMYVCYVFVHVVYV